VAYFTGGGAAHDGLGNGRAAAILLARAGTRVLVVDHQRALAERTVAMIAAEGGTAAAHEADVTDDAGCRDMVTAALDHFGRLDLLDNNVGIGSRGTVVDEAPETWRRVMQVNVETMFLASRHAIPRHAEDGGPRRHRQRVVDLRQRPRGLTSYSTPQGAVIALTRAMAVDHGREGIRVNCVAPGRVGRTPLRSASRARAGTSVTPCASSCPTTRATSPATPSWSTAASRCKLQNATQQGTESIARQ
jgi:NAD(P)-dependent dehydrogenase (short-subunit alcohol dehydrogenase family)